MRPAGRCAAPARNWRRFWSTSRRASPHRVHPAPPRAGQPHPAGTGIRDPRAGAGAGRTLAEQLGARAAVTIDNARRFTREHTLAIALQRSLLPRALPAQNALDVAHRYLPAHAGSGGVGGHWFDVIPLPGARVALVVGDVVGHGLHAAATMGRLRTAVHNFSSLDLAPDELLWHLDELVTRIDQDESGDGPPVTGATCLYALYDPGTQVCTMAHAGHFEPVVVHPDGSAAFAAVPGGPPLGLAGLPTPATRPSRPAARFWTRCCPNSPRTTSRRWSPARVRSAVPVHRGRQGHLDGTAPSPRRVGQRTVTIGGARGRL
ncbi:hypothetical protein J3A78_007153 [Streptomyces sp. PvR006]|nr:hypothetical protein [Streptomyces sp. PvR006]